MPAPGRARHGLGARHPSRRHWSSTSRGLFFTHVAASRPSVRSLAGADSPHLSPVQLAWPETDSAGRGQWPAPAPAPRPRRVCCEWCARARRRSCFGADPLLLSDTEQETAASRREVYLSLARLAHEPSQRPPLFIFFLEQGRRRGSRRARGRERGRVWPAMVVGGGSGRRRGRRRPGWWRAAAALGSVSVYRQVCSRILLAVRFVGRNRLLWNSMVQGT